MKSRLFAYFFLLLLCSNSCYLVREIDPDKNRDFKTDPSLSPISTTLLEIMEYPEQYKFAAVEFWAVFNRHYEDVWSPFRTTFTPEHYTSFSIWPDYDPITLDNYNKLLQTVFFHKDNPHIHKLYKVKRFNKVLLKGIVKDVYNNMPWIEVLEIIHIGGYADCEVPVDETVEGKTPQEIVTTLVKHKEELNDKIETLKKKIGEQEEVITKLLEQNKHLGQMINTLKNNIDEKDDIIERLTKNIEQLRREINSLIKPKGNK